MQIKKTTLYDVAREAKVSPKTVSRVINSESTVRKKTRETVLAAIESLNYRPNSFARNLRSSRSYVIALLYDNRSPPYILELQMGILPVCEAAGFNIIIQPYAFDSETLIEDIGKWLERSRVDGLVLAPPLTDHQGLLDVLKENKIEFVRISPIDKSDISPFVYGNDRFAAREMTNHLISLGHESIGFIKGHPDHNGAIERLKGYEDALVAANIPIRKTLIKQGDFSFESGEICARSLLREATPPSAIFASNDNMASAVMKVARQIGLELPSELSIAGFDNSRISQQLWPTLTTVEQPLRELAARSTELLINNILGKKTDKLESEFLCKLIIRESTSDKQK
ncbi:HTH-type transcriptional regulator DegA [Paraglaciecola mesophila]|uniref:HTH-type transcriptional regulator DegA n=1 Tax=Paraglaciecola mesophila TaxID=197222 RepID=A0A857JR96_9ALTE|nr:LacI family DNA-binding transcriptional regulator [Paraglaciecola mesophila]QHJ13084.1 HTH-type transcriptional regulator DegA [Paraglaciecola mesophila]